MAASDLTSDPRLSAEGGDPDLALTQDLLTFLEKSPTCFQVIANFKKALLFKGYTYLPEDTPWVLLPAGKYFTTRNGSSIIAFRTPDPAPTGFQITASHSDSPTFKIKANPELKEGEAYIRLNAEPYGGMLMAPWFDRPLSVAGRVLAQAEGGVTEIPVVVDRDLLLIPSVAIHMNREANKGYAYNAQTDLLPLLGEGADAGAFRRIVAEAAGVSPDAILGSDLFLYVRGRGSVWGASNEFVSAGHLDDLQCAFSCFRGFVSSEGTKTPAVPVFACFDNEEVGSLTKQGADSTFLEDVLSRIAEGTGMTREAYHAAVAKSFMLSADNAHALHPNHPEKADPANRPLMNHGIVIKYHAGQKYTTDGVTAALFKLLCQDAGVPFQEFTNRSDMAGGSTLGNLSNAHVSLNCVDIGLPQLAMHSCFETAGVRDTGYLVRAARAFYGSSLRRDGDTLSWVQG